MTNLAIGFAAALLLTATFEYGTTIKPDAPWRQFAKRDTSVVFWSLSGFLCMVSSVDPVLIIGALPVALAHIQLCQHHSSKVTWMQILRHLRAAFQRTYERFRHG